MISVTDITVLIGRYLPEPHAGLLAGMLVGTKQTITPDLYDDLITTGTLHIVALSGTNITILAQLCMRVLLWVLNRRVAAFVSALIIIGFVLFVGPSPSVVRAAIMGCLSLLAVVTGRRAWGWWFWFVTCAAMLVLAPKLITEVSFQLSAAASLGLILFAPEPSGHQKAGIPGTESLNADSVFPEKDDPGRIPVGIGYLARAVVRGLLSLAATDLTATLAAQVFTIPIIFLTFRRLSLISPIPNILIGWVLSPLTAAGIFMVAAGYIIPPLATVAGWFIWLGLSYVIWVIRVSAMVPFAGVGW